MSTQRLEAFSDAVLAIIITIMVLELRIPHSAEWSALRPLTPTFLIYALSFLFLAIYWNNHHHMMHVVSKVNGKILWANMHLLFWLSLVPFVTGWMGENHFEPVPTAAYGFVLLMSAVSWYILRKSIISFEGKESKLHLSTGRYIKGIISTILYAIAIPLAFLNCWISLSIYVLVSLMWFMPDRRLESGAQ